MTFGALVDGQEDAPLNILPTGGVPDILVPQRHRSWLNAVAPLKASLKSVTKPISQLLMS